MSDAIEELVQSMSGTIALAAATNKATGHEIMLSIAAVCIVAHQLYAVDLEDETVANLLDSVALSVRPLEGP